MGSTLVRWTLRAGLGSTLLLALSVLPLVMTDAPAVSAAEKADLLDIYYAATAVRLR